MRPQPDFRSTIFGVTSNAAAQIPGDLSADEKIDLAESITAGLA